MEEFIWKIIHKPTGLFYCSRKGRFRNSITNLSSKGNHYQSEKVAEKVLKEDCKRASINEAQVKKHNLEKIGDSKWCYSDAKVEDFEILKYELVLVK